MRPDVESRDAAGSVPFLNFASRKPLRLTWAQPRDNEWWRLLDVDLGRVRAIGVYVIWHLGNPWRWIKVGQGHVAERLEARRDDWVIAQYKHLGLCVTWADVSVDQVNGVEAYLGATCHPLVADLFPDEAPIPVNLPGQQS